MAFPNPITTPGATLSLKQVCDAYGIGYDMNNLRAVQFWDINGNASSPPAAPANFPLAGTFGGKYSRNPQSVSQLYSSGTTITPPGNKPPVISFTVQVVGAGGGGGGAGGGYSCGAFGDFKAGGGGGGGSSGVVVASSGPIPFSPSTPFLVTYQAGGAPGGGANACGCSQSANNGGDGTNGGSTVFTYGTITITAPGGIGTGNHGGGATFGPGSNEGTQGTGAISAGNQSAAGANGFGSSPGAGGVSPAIFGPYGYGGAGGQGGNGGGGAPGYAGNFGGVYITWNYS